ncbi:MAG: hypothetical protein AAFX56_15860 [Pseudomonadota bacterium]
MRAVRNCIYASGLPESGEFNLLPVVRFANDAALAPNEERYDEFMKAFGEARSAETTEYAHHHGRISIPPDHFQMRFTLVER